MGVVYGRANEHVKAYVCRKQAYIIAMKIYGPEHKKTEKYKIYLLDIAKEAKKRAQDIDVMADDELALWKSLIQQWLRETPSIFNVEWLSSALSYLNAWVKALLNQCSLWTSQWSVFLWWL